MFLMIYKLWLSISAQIWVIWIWNIDETAGFVCSTKYGVGTFTKRCLQIRMVLIWLHKRWWQAFILVCGKWRWKICIL